MIFTPAAASRAPRSRVHPVVWWCLGLVVAAFIVYSPSLAGEFLWDDEDMIVSNPLIRSPVFVLENFTHYLDLKGASAHYRPVQNLSYLTDYWCWGMNPFGYHLTSTLLHGVSACLLFLLLRQIVRRLYAPMVGDEARSESPNRMPFFDWFAFAAVLLWTVHPVHSAAVAYVSGRADPLAMAFGVGAWSFLLKATDDKVSAPRRAGLLAAGGLCAFCALASRESAAILLGLFAGFVVFLQPQVVARLKLPALLAVGLAGAAYAGCRLGLPTREVDLSMPYFDPLGRVLLLLRSLVAYAQLLFWPARLFMDRQLGCEAAILAHGSTQGALWFAARTWCGLIIIALLGVGAVWPGAGRALRCYGVAWFILAFLPISNLVRLNATVAEHWLYLPSVGLLIFGLGWLVEQPRPMLLYRTLALVLALAAAAGTRTFVRSEDWADSRTFYARNVAAGGNSPRMRFNYAMACRRAGDVQTSRRALTDLTVDWPDYVPARRMIDRFVTENLDPAARENSLRGQLERSNTDPRANAPQQRLARLQLTAQLAVVLSESGRPEEALATLETALDHANLDPANWPVVSREIALLHRFDRKGEALALVSAFAKTHWWHREAQICRGKLQRQLGDLDNAVASFRRADRLDVWNADALCEIASVEVQRGQWTQALVTQKAAVHKSPLHPKSHYLLGVLYAQLHDPTRSHEQFAIAQSLETGRFAVDQSPPAAREPAIH